MCGMKLIFCVKINIKDLHKFNYVLLVFFKIISVITTFDTGPLVFVVNLVAEAPFCTP